MQLYGVRNHSDGRYYILANVYSLYVANPLKSIIFLIDSGSTLTSISYVDALLIGIDFSKLQEVSKIEMINNVAPALVIPIGAISLTLPDNKSVISELMPRIYVHKPAVKTRQDAVNASNIPSVLGIDFLSRYRLTLQNDFCILEK